MISTAVLAFSLAVWVETPACLDLFATYGPMIGVVGGIWSAAFCVGLWMCLVNDIPYEKCGQLYSRGYELTLCSGIAKR